MALDSHPGSSLEFLLNGRPIRAQGFHAQTTLLDFLRSQGLTGAKEGCAEGECDACTVVMVKAVPDEGPFANPPRRLSTAYVPVNSCLLFLPMLAGQEIYTVEALANHGPLAEAQQALADSGGSQCGYCTPGFVMSLFAEQYRPGREGPCDPHAMSGNLCRCTGYRPIRDAALALGPAPAGSFSGQAGQTRAGGRSSRSDCFARPRTLDECLELLAEHLGSGPACARIWAGVRLESRRWISTSSAIFRTSSLLPPTYPSGIGRTSRTGLVDVVGGNSRGWRWCGSQTVKSAALKYIGTRPMAWADAR